MNLFEKIFEKEVTKLSLNKNDDITTKLKKCTNRTIYEIYKLGDIEDDCLDELYYFAQWVTMQSAIIYEIDYNVVQDYYINHDVEYLMRKEGTIKEARRISSERFDRFNEYNDLKEILISIIENQTVGTELMKFSRIVGVHIYNNDYGKMLRNMWILKIPPILIEHGLILSII